MPAYNFKTIFAPAVESGAKPHTIRPQRKRPTVPGDMLYLYTGMRTKFCRLLKKTVCTAVIPIEIKRNSVRLDGRELSLSEVEALARADGFPDAQTFFAFFATTYPAGMFNLELIKWS